MLDRHFVAIWTGGHVAIPECISQWRQPFVRKSPEKVLVESTKPCFTDRTGVMGDQPTETITPACGVKEFSPVQRVESCRCKRRRVANVVKPTGRF